MTPRIPCGTSPTVTLEKTDDREAIILDIGVGEKQDRRETSGRNVIGPSFDERRDGDDVDYRAVRRCGCACASRQGASLSLALEL